MTEIVLLRHGQSEWNRAHRLTGWADVALSEHGEVQSRRAGIALAAAGYEFDVAFTSVLRRAADSLALVLEAMNHRPVPVHRCWQLNERHYGALEGLGPVRAVLRFGPRRVIACQRRFDMPPPLLAPDDPRFPGHHARFADVPPAELPRGETMADAAARMRPVWRERIVPALRGGERVLVVGHKNILRGLVREIGDYAGRDVERLDIRTGIPWVYELDADLKPLRVRQVAVT